MNLRKLFLTIIILLTFGSVCFTTSTPLASADQTSTPLKGKININTATHQQLVMLRGIDRSVSFKIVMHRRPHKFTKIEDILKVQGIDRQLYAKIKPFIVVGGKTTFRVSSS